MNLDEEYEYEYGNIPKDRDECLNYVLSQCNKRTLARVQDKISSIENIDWKTYDITIYLVPKATPRPRYSSASGVFYVKGAADLKRYFSKLVKGQDIPYIRTATILDCEVYLPTPRSLPKADRVLAEMGLIRPVSKPDWDNLGKTYSDMVQKILLEDDSLIIDGRCQKFYSMKPRIVLHFKYQDGYDSSFNERKFKV